MSDQTQLRFSGRKLLEARIKAKKSRMGLAKSINFEVGPEAIAKYEKGVTVPNIDVALKIVRALGIKPGDLIDAG